MVSCNENFNALDWANMYVEHVVQHEGLSAVIISDRGPQSISAFNLIQGLISPFGHLLEYVYYMTSSN